MKEKVLYTIEATIDGEDYYYNESTGRWWAYWGLSGGTLYTTEEEARTIAGLMHRATSILAVDGVDNHRLYYV